MSQAVSKSNDDQATLDNGSEVFFYHMTRTPLEATLPVLLQKSLEAGWKVCVRGRDRQHLEKMDEILWLASDEGFLPHGLDGGLRDQDQPVLLTSALEIPNLANALICVDGAEIEEADMTSMTRISVLFDGNNPDAVAHARDQWKLVVAAGCIAKYWSQETGQWAMKASSA